MFPTATSINISESNQKSGGMSFVFDFSKGDFVLENGKLRKSKDISVWIEKILRTEKDRYEIFKDTNYGVRLEDLIIGTNYDLSFTESEIKREIEEALLQNPKITAIASFEMTRRPNGITVTVEVVTDDQTRNTASLTF